jgi:UPF0755 protein
VNDDLGLFRDVPDNGGRSARSRERRPRRTLAWSLIVVLLVVVVAGVYVGLREIHIGGPPDYSGTGTTGAVAHVRSGASLREIGESLESQGIVKSAAAFVVASKDNDESRGIQPGFYQLKHHMSGHAALAAFLDPGSKVGRLEVKPGARLADVHAPNGDVRPGIFTLLAKASCAKIDGHSTCVSAEKFRTTARHTELSDLGVPAWATKPASTAPAGHRLEGLIAPGLYSVKPGGTAKELLHSVLDTSFETLSARGLPAAAHAAGSSPYTVLTVASLSEAEGIKSDFAKIARVTRNRLAAGKKLQYDSTVNYVLDRPALATSPEDRAKQGPYNSYARAGLPPTPIDSPSTAAIRAARHPAKGNWLFFVRCHSDGSSCFSRTAVQHAKQVKKAQARGAY